MNKEDLGSDLTANPRRNLDIVLICLKCKELSTFRNKHDNPVCWSCIQINKREKTREWQKNHPDFRKKKIV